MSQAQSGSGIGMLVAIIVGFALLLQLLTGGASSSTSSYTTPSRDNSFERRYVEERFKQEGYNSSDSAQAADAILKFQRAQEARRNR
jgi:hypothetical protein